MWEGLTALLTAEVIGASVNPLLVKVGVSEIPPLTFTALRFFIAIIILSPFYLRQKNNVLSLKDKRSLFIKSIPIFLNVSLFSIGIQYTTTIMSQILYTLTPLLVFILAYLLLKEKLTKEKLIGLIIAFIGVSFLLQQSISKVETLSFGEPLGNIILLCAVVSWSFYFISSRSLLKKYSSVTVTFYNALTCAILLIILVPFELMIRPLIVSNITVSGISSVFGIAIFASVIMTYLIQLGIKKTSAFTASLFQYMGPFFVTVTAIPILGEKVTLGLFIGGLLIIVGVFYAASYAQIRKSFRSVLQ